jgi:hypothetical protein
MTPDNDLQHREPVSGAHPLRAVLVLAFLAAWVICWAIDGRANPSHHSPARRAIQLGAVFTTDDLTDLAFPPRDRKITTTNFWVWGAPPGRIGGSGQGALRLVSADIDHDGDTDLIGITRGLRLIVWLNNGKGDFTPQLAHSTHGLNRVVLYSNLTEADAPVLSFEPFQLAARLIPVILPRMSRKSRYFCRDDFSPLAARAPPRPLPVL